MSDYKKASLIYRVISMLAAIAGIVSYFLMADVVLMIYLIFIAGYFSLRSQFASLRGDIDELKQGE